MLAMATPACFDECGGYVKNLIPPVTLPSTCFKTAQLDILRHRGGRGSGNFSCGTVTPALRPLEVSASRECSSAGGTRTSNLLNLCLASRSRVKRSYSSQHNSFLLYQLYVLCRMLRFSSSRRVVVSLLSASSTSTIFSVYPVRVPYPNTPPIY